MSLMSSLRDAARSSPRLLVPPPSAFAWLCSLSASVPLALSPRQLSSSPSHCLTGSPFLTRAWMHYRRLRIGWGLTLLRYQHCAACAFGGAAAGG
jgi:hypothetical protein